MNNLDVKADFIDQKLGSSKLTVKEKVSYGLGDAGCAFAMTTVYQYLMFFYTDVFGISIAAVGTLFLVARIWDAVNDPIIGGMIDKSNPKRGKYRSPLFYGCIPLATFSILCFTAPDLSQTGKLVYAYITYIGAGMLYTYVNTSYSSLTSVMTDSPSERTSITTYRMYIACIGNVLLSIGLPMMVAYFGKESAGKGYQIAAIVFAGISVLLFLTTYFNCKERVRIPSEKVSFKDMFRTVVSNKPLLLLCLIFIVVFNNVTISTSVGMYYIKYNVGREDLTSIFILFTSLPGLISLAIMPYLVKKVGKKQLLILGTIVSMIGLAGLYIFSAKGLFLVFASRFVAGFGATLIMALIWDMVPDTIDYGEYTTGKRLAAINNAAVGFFFKIGTALAGIIPGFILDRAGYVPNTVQTPQALDAIKFTLAGVPFIFFVIALIPMFIYKLDNKECERIANGLKGRRLNRG